MIWDRTRTTQRLRSQLREHFPAALEAFEDLDAPDVLELLGKAPDPARARRLTRAQVAAALKRARRWDIAGKTDAILAALRGEHLGQPAALTAAYAATARSLIAVITTLNAQVKILEEQVRDNFGSCRVWAISLWAAIAQASVMVWTNGYSPTTRPTSTGSSMVSLWPAASLCQPSSPSGSEVTGVMSAHVSLSTRASDTFTI
jgi:hypothetical protein